MRAALLALLVSVGSLVWATPAEAHSFGASGPLHNHLPCTRNDCYRWILVNGVVYQGPSIHLIGQWPYVLVLCSLRYTVEGVNAWRLNYSRSGTSNTSGVNHSYCQYPRYGSPPKRWSLRP